MPLLPPHYLNSVVAIGTDGDDGHREWVASGFLYFHRTGHDEAGQSHYAPLLVTNRHVVEGLTTIYFRANPLASGAVREYRLMHDVEVTDPSSFRFHFHSDPGIDLAATALNFQFLQSESLDVYFLESDTDCAPPSMLREAGVSEGDLVFIAGFPMGLIGSTRDTAIIRIGCISRIQELYAGSSTAFLVDGLVFPGNSGGPVIIRPQAASLTGPTEAVTRAWVIGVVAGYMPYRDEAVSRQTGQTRVVFEENSGLAGVIPMNYLFELAEVIVGESREKLIRRPAQEEGLASTDEIEGS